MLSILVLIKAKPFRKSMALAHRMPGGFSLWAKTGLLKSVNKLPIGFLAAMWMKKAIPKELVCRFGDFIWLQVQQSKEKLQVFLACGGVAKVFTPDGKWDWTKYEGQRWFLKAAQKRGVEKFLAFTIAPPVEYAKNGKAYLVKNQSSAIFPVSRIPEGIYLVSDIGNRLVESKKVVVAKN
jgi:hypothetical protein